MSPVRGARGSVPLRESGHFPPGVKEALAMCDCLGCEYKLIKALSFPF